MNPKRIVAVCMFVMLMLLAGTGNAATSNPLRILFVGNSLTYVGNLPAVFTALSADNGHHMHTDMLVKGGETLTQWLDSGAVPKALQVGHFDYVVLQERGNDFACGFGPQVCKDSRHSLQALVKIVRASNAEPILLGTYQVSHDASDALIAAESKAARADGVPYLAVSARLNEGRTQDPYFDWFAKAGHPGHDLVLLEAILLYRQLYGALPQAKTLDVRAPMFVPGSKFAAPSPVSLPLLPEIPLAGGYVYSKREMSSVIGLAH